jgi:hypothetical protein
MVISKHNWYDYKSVKKFNQPIKSCAERISRVLVSTAVAKHFKNIITGKTKPKPQSKQLRYYYRNRKQRLAYQKEYYQKNKDSILYHKALRKDDNKVKRTKNNISLIWKIYPKAYRRLNNRYDRKMFMDAFYHVHGRPNLKRKHSRYALGLKKLKFHLVSNLLILYPNEDPYVTLSYLIDESEIKVPYMTSQQLTAQIAHCLGFKKGDSLSFKGINPFNGKTEKHTLCFDGSGLDISHSHDLTRLMEIRIETGAKGADLALLFANKHSVDGYLQLWRGNKLIQTSEAENALRDYIKQRENYAFST